ncbi:hypothetical protein EJB05_48250, partial [Eragrostis curvula]
VEGCVLNIWLNQEAPVERFQRNCEYQWLIKWACLKCCSQCFDQDLLCKRIQMIPSKACAPAGSDPSRGLHMIPFFSPCFRNNYECMVRRQSYEQ